MINLKIAELRKRSGMTQQELGDIGGKLLQTIKLRPGGILAKQSGISEADKRNAVE